MTPSLGTSICHRCGPNKQINKQTINKFKSSVALTTFQALSSNKWHWAFKDRLFPLSQKILLDSNCVDHNGVVKILDSCAVLHTHMLTQFPHNPFFSCYGYVCVCRGDTPHSGGPSGCHSGGHVVPSDTVSVNIYCLLCPPY